MEHKNSKFGIAGFFIIIATLQDTPVYFKYFLLTMAAISLILGIVQYQKAFKTKRLSKDS